MIIFFHASFKEGQNSRYAKVRLLLFLALLPSLAWPKFGTEIELVGARHRAELGCLLGSGAAVVAALPLGAGAYFSENEETTVAAGIAGGTPVFCYGLYKARGKANLAYLRLLEAEIKRRTPSAEITHEPSGTLKQDALYVKYEDGSKIVFSQDPNVIEVKTILPDANAAATRADFFQREIYDLGKAVGLRAPRIDGPWNGGHIHIDLEDAFGGDPQKLKRFALDFWAHPELIDGLLVKDGLNAKPLRLEDPKVLAKIDAFAAAMDELSAAGTKLDFATLNDFFRHSLFLFQKDKALNLNNHLGTLEIRGLRSQKNAAELARILKLIEAEIRYTNGQPNRSFAELRAEAGSPRTNKEKAASWRRYVQRAGLDYEEMKQVVPARFREGQGICARWFAGFTE